LTSAFLVVAPNASAQPAAQPSVTREGVEQVKSAADARKPIDMGRIQQPIARMMAAMTNAAVADSQAFDETLEAAGIEKIITLEGLTPSSEVLDHCDRIGTAALAADIMGKRFDDYVALARKQGEIEVAAHHIQPIELSEFLDGTAGGRASFEQRWAASAALAHEAAGLCMVLARRHWSLSPSNVLEIEEPDLTEAQRRIESLQQAVQRVLAVEEARNEEAKKQMEKLPNGQ
jgi:hypothetical protein